MTEASLPTRRPIREPAKETGTVVSLHLRAVVIDESIAGDDRARPQTSFYRDLAKRNAARCGSGFPGEHGTARRTPDSLSGSRTLRLRTAQIELRDSQVCAGTTDNTS